MIRYAVIQHLRQNVPSLGGRVYQAFVVDTAHEPRPFATVKLMSGGASARISYAGFHDIEVRVYGDRTDFVELDAIIDEVIAALHGKHVADLETGERYEVTWLPGINDFEESDRQLIGRLVRFQAVALYERG